jgi:tetratricopeptide (TPR) repeat protein
LHVDGREVDALLTDIQGDETMKHSPKLLAMILLAGAAIAHAAGGGGAGGADEASAVNADPVIATARAAIAKQDWASAQAGLKQALAAKPNNADYHNLYAYSMRKAGNADMALVFQHYSEALRIDPKHRGAHEYSGEAYLATNDLPKAKAHLAALDKLCTFGCEEFTDLKKAVAAYEASHKR